MSVRPSAQEAPNAEPSAARLRVLAGVSHAFAMVVTDYAELVETIVRTAADRIGDGCQMLLLSDDGQLLTAAALAHRDPAVEADIRAFMVDLPQPLATSQSVSAGVVRSGEPLLVPEIDPDVVMARADDALKPLLARVRVYSGVIVPIRARAAIIGALSMNRHRPGCSYTPDDLTLLQDIADRAGLAIENARLYRDLERRVSERTAELEAANRALTAANTELETFSYSVSHDLRAPLRAIDGFSKALLDEYGKTLDDGARHYLARVRTAAQRMSALIDDLLNLARITRAPMRRQNIDITGVARSVFEQLRRADPSRNVAIEVAEGLSARGDLRLVTLVVENLLGNAWKYTAKRSDARIAFGHEQHGTQEVFFVRDNGAGFDMAHAGRLFTPFQRLHDAADFEGSGIGLASVHRIITRHGGRIWASAAVNEGATFFFTLGNGG